MITRNEGFEYERVFDMSLVIWVGGRKKLILVNLTLLSFSINVGVGLQSEEINRPCQCKKGLKVK